MASTGWRPLAGWRRTGRRGMPYRRSLREGWRGWGREAVSPSTWAQNLEGEAPLALPEPAIRGDFCVSLGTGAAGSGEKLCSPFLFIHPRSF